MQFARLSELLEAEEAGITSGLRKTIDSAKAGWKAAKDKHKEAEDKTKEAEAEAKAKQAESEKAAKNAVSAAKKAVGAEEKIKKKAATEAEKAAKAASAEHQAQTAEELQAMRTDLDNLMKDFFDKFPAQTKIEINDVMKRFNTKEATTQGYQVYMSLASRLSKLLDGFNKSLVAAGKVRKEVIDRYARQSARLVKNGVASLDTKQLQAMTTFTQREGKFFKRLLRTDANFKIDDIDFKDLLSLKIKQTDAERVGDAAQAVNLLFSLLINDFGEHAKVFRDAAEAFDDEDGVAEKATRDTARATTAAETEASAKAAGK